MKRRPVKGIKMTRKLKMAGVLMALVAILALTASSAQATFTFGRLPLHR